MELSLDIRTLNAVAALTSVFTGAGLLIAWGTLPKRSSLAYWAAGYVLIATGFLLLWSRDILPAYLSILAGNLLLAAGSLIIVRGIERFLDIAAPRWPLLLVLAGTAIALIYYLYVQPSMLHRIVIVTVVFGVAGFVGSWRLFSNLHPSTRFVQVCVGVLAGIHGIVMICRVVASLVWRPGPDFFMPSAITTVSFLDYLLLLPCIGFGLLSMVYKRLNWQLRIEIALREESENALLITKRNLENAIAEIKTLKGIIPICSVCKSIRDDRGLWEQLEDYICTHSDAEFSHGICPDCAREMYPDLSLGDT